MAIGNLQLAIWQLTIGNLQLAIDNRQVPIWSAAANARDHLQSPLHCWNGVVNIYTNFNFQLSQTEIFSLTVHSSQVLLVAVLSISLLAFIILRYKRRWLRFKNIF